MAAKKVASDPEVAAQIVNMRPVAFAVSDSAEQFRASYRPTEKSDRSWWMAQSDTRSKFFPTIYRSRRR